MVYHYIVHMERNLYGLPLHWGGGGAEGREGLKRRVRSTRGFVTKNVHSLTTLLSHSKVIREYSYKCIK